MARRMKGEGSLYQTKDKTWVCQYYDADGKRRQHRRGIAQHRAQPGQHAGKDEAYIAPK